MRSPEDEAHAMMQGALDQPAVCKHGSICQGFIAAIAARDAEHAEALATALRERDTAREALGAVKLRADKFLAERDYCPLCVVVCNLGHDHDFEDERYCLLEHGQECPSRALTPTGSPTKETSPGEGTKKGSP